MEIYLARHGTTAWNAKHMIQGRTDTPLDPTGVEMARQTGMKFICDNITFDKIYSSPLQRAYDTATLMAQRSDIITDERLIELAFGDFEGKVVEDMIADPDCAFRFFKSAPDRYDALIRDINSPAFESLTELVDRASSFLIEKVEPLANTDSRILISGHGALNKGLLMHIRGINDMSRFWEGGLQSNCGVTVITLTEHGYEINDRDRMFYDPSLTDSIKKLL